MAKQGDHYGPKQKFGGKRVSYWLFALYGFLVSLAIGVLHLLFFGTSNMGERAVSQPWYILVPIMGLGYAPFFVPGGLLMAAANNRAWRRRQ